MADLDLKIFYWLYNLPHEGWIYYFFLIFHYLALFGIGAAIFWITLYIFDKQNRQKIIFGGLAIITAWGLNTIIIKNIFQSERPFSVLENVISGAEKLSSYSFPSGHATASFALATTLVLIYPQKRFVYLGFIFALFISISRIYFGVHYPSDILGGIVLGIVVPILIFKSAKIKFFFNS